MLRRVDVRPHSVELVLDSRRLYGRDHPELALSALRRRLAEHEEAVAEVDDLSALRVRIPVQLKFRGGRRGMIQSGAALARCDTTLIRGLRAAHRTLEHANTTPLRPSAGPPDGSATATSYLRKLIRLAFLAPDLQLAILDGRQPDRLTLASLLDGPPLRDWEAQRRWWRAL